MLRLMGNRSSRSWSRQRRLLRQGAAQNGWTCWLHLLSQVVVTARLCVVLQRGSGILPRLLRWLKMPVLVLAATKDPAVPDVVSSFTPVAEASHGRVLLDRIEDADHFFRDLFAEDAADRIAEFINQIR